jgi:mRNA interferase MazF
MTTAAQRGDVWWIDLNPTIGAEIQKLRPCVVVSSNAIGKLPLKVIVPLTDWNPAFENSGWHIPIAASPRNGLAKKSAADTFQVRCLSLNRFSKQAGTLTADEMEEISCALATVLQIRLN